MSFGVYDIEPTGNVIRFIELLIEFVQRHPEVLRHAGATLDEEYSTQAIRDRQASQLRELRTYPNYNKRSLAYERRNYDYDYAESILGFRPTPEEAVLGPPKRQWSLDGELVRPSISLRDRYDIAYQDVFEDETSVARHVVEEEERTSIAASRVLMAWLRLDPDRAKVQRITEFQDLLNVATKDGMPIVWSEGELDQARRGRDIEVDRAGSLPPFAIDWLVDAFDAFKCITRVSARSLFYKLQKLEDKSIKQDLVSKERKKGASPLDSMHKNGGEATKKDAQNLRGRHSTSCVEEAKASGMKPKDVARRRAEKYVEAHGFPSLNALCALCVCHHSIMRKAIKSSEKLKRAKSESAWQQGQVRSRPADPEDPAWPMYIDEVLGELIEFATTSQRAKLNTPEMRRELTGKAREDLEALVEDAIEQAKRRKIASKRA